MRRKIGVLISVIVSLSIVLLTLAVAQQQAQSDREKAIPQQGTQPATPATEPQAGSTTGAPVGDASTLSRVMVSTEFILGSNLQDSKNENLGEITQLLINPETGLVSYAVVSLGGFMGMGTKRIVIPWQAIELVRDQNKLLLHVSKAVFDEAQEYAPVNQ